MIGRTARTNLVLLALGFVLYFSVVLFVVWSDLKSGVNYNHLFVRLVSDATELSGIKIKFISPWGTVSGLRPDSQGVWRVPGNEKRLVSKVIVEIPDSGNVTNQEFEYTFDKGPGEVWNFTRLRRSENKTKEYELILPTRFSMLFPHHGSTVNWKGDWSLFLRAGLRVSYPFILIVLLISLTYRNTFWEYSGIGSKDIAPDLSKFPVGIAIWGLNALLLFIVVKIYVSALLFAPVNDDAGTYLSMVEKVQTGSVLYKDIRFGYPPLAFHILALVRNLTPSNWQDYTVYLGTIFGFIFGQGALIYLILRYFRISQALSMFAALWALVLLANYEGLAVFLEPFVAFTCLLATYLILCGRGKWQFLLAAGVCACLSMLSKQYGVVALPIFAVFLMRNRLKLVWFLTGYAIPLILYGFYFCVIHAIPVRELLDQLTGVGYAVNGYMAMGEFDYGVHLRFVLLAVPFLFVVPAAIYWSDSSTRRYSLLFTGLCLFMSLALVIRPFKHYFGLVIALIVILEILSLSVLQKYKRLMSALTLLFIGWAGLQTQNILTNIGVNPGVRAHQIEVANEISKTWPIGTKVLSYASPEFMWLGRFDPIDNSRPSFSFLSNFSGAEQIEFIFRAQNILIDEKDWLYFTHEREKIEREGKPMKQILQEQQFELVGVVADRYQLWQRL